MLIKVAMTSCTVCVKTVSLIASSSEFTESYYRILGIMGVEVIFNHADYRLLSRRVVEVLRDYSEVNLFLRGIIPLLGFNSKLISYHRKERFAGASKYLVRKMLSLAIRKVS